MRLFIATLCLTACAESANPTGHTDPDPEVYEPVCAPPSPTACGSDAASVRGTVRLADGFTADDTTGRLFIGLSHEWLGGGAQGGFPHTFAVVDDVDLASGPVQFELDMCSGGEMWSEENCSYQLVAILDENGNQGIGNMIPDTNELVGKVTGLEVSCAAESPCLDVVVDCVGPSCVAFQDPSSACVCADPSCGSDISTCE